jgi:cold shock protein
MGDQQMPSGTVKWFNMQKGYGFITPEGGGQDVFVHISAVQQSGLPELRDGQAVEFQIEPGKGGKTAATNLKLR